MTPMAAARVFAKRRREYRALQEIFGRHGHHIAAHVEKMRARAITALWNDPKEASEDTADAQQTD